MKLAAKTGLWMGKGDFDASTTATDAYTTPAGFGPKLGALAFLSYKTAEVRAQIDTDAAGTLRVLAGSEELAALNFSGQSSIAEEVDLMNVQGQTRITLAVDVDSAGSGTGTVQAALDVDQPGVIEGGC